MSTTFHRWMRDHAPAARDDAHATRRLWTRIEDRMDQRRQRRITRGTGLAAAMVILVVVGIVDVTPLGGNNWNLLPTTSSDGNFADPFTGDVHQYAEIPADEGSTQRFWEQVREKRAAGQHSLDAIDFFELSGEFQWMLFYRYVIDGRSRSASGAIDRPSTMPRELGTWFYDQTLTLDQDIADGTFRPAPSRRYRVNGHDFWFHTWVKDTELGPFYYGTAVIPDDLK